WLNAGLKLEKHPLGIMHEDEIVHRYNTTKAVEQFYVYQKKYIDKVVSEREATKPYELHSY
ncbi:hypothetical protein HDV02_003831, partial [Globomyces sp. JEL0801]